MNNKEEILSRIKALDGISCADWNTLKCIVERSFEVKKRELEKTLKLSQDSAENTIRSLFE